MIVEGWGVARERVERDGCRRGHAKFEELKSSRQDVPWKMRL